MEITSCNFSPTQFFEETGLKIRNSLGRVFSTLTAIQKDNCASVQLLKIGRYAIFAFRVYHGKAPEKSLAHRDFDAAINLLEGLQFIAAISSLIPMREDGNYADKLMKAPLLERISDIGFKVSDGFSGALWLLSKGIPVLGPLSQNIMIVESFEIAALGAALIASIADGKSASKIISKQWNVNAPDKTSAIWRLCERITGVASMTLIVVGASGTLASVAAGLAIVSAACGLVRFACDLDLPEEAKQNKMNS